MIKLRHRLILLMSILFVASCAGMHESKDFERHRNSQLEVPYDRDDVFYFDVSFTAQYPDDDETAEAIRLEWLDQWLDQRSLCPEGFEVVTRRPFEFLEDNPARHDVRYEVKCNSAPPDA